MTNRIVKFIMLGSGLVILFLGQTVSAATTTVAVDTDNDGLSDDLEMRLGTDPNNADTDGDKYPDGIEIKNGFSPFAGNRSRKIKRTAEVDLSTQKFYFSVNGVRIGEMLTSTGRPGVNTPVGTFKILKKVPVKNYRTVTGGSYPNTKWNMLFEAKTGLYLHGAYWHNDFGIRPRSGGCVNLKTADAAKMYKFLDIGDEIKIFGKTPTKPLKLAKKKS